ncbi:MAG: M23 family metallopeptidase [Leptolyngbyaceae cyanobacterium SL_7_1]|nr:M23 family metallopeptidase [Leptolyngbyaceae cyanobacterium SL_7_1]
MTPKRELTQLSKVPFHSSIMAQGMSWLGGLGVVTSGMVLAQAPVAAEAEGIPNAQDLLGVEVAPSVVPAPVVAPAPASPQGVAPESSAPEPSVPQPSVIPNITPTPAAVPLPAIAPPESQEIPQTVGHFDSPYIDSTNYNIGATESSRPSVVLSERSSGCEQMVQYGQTVPRNLCNGSNRTVATNAAGAGRPTSVNVGPISVSPSGIRLNASARDFYNLTTRPLALPGNGNLQLMFPLSIPVAITSSFGWRVHPIFGNTRFHAGTDLGAPSGTPVVAAYSGQVAIADFMNGYGLTVVLQHNDGEQQTLYAHMSEVYVRPGETIEQGEVIGRVGSTGNSTGPHLHFEVRQRTSEGWVAVDPGGMLESSLARFMDNLQNPQTIEVATLVGLKDLSKASQVAGTAYSVLQAHEKAEATQATALNLTEKGE